MTGDAQSIFARAIFARAVDALVPGDGAWPPASACIAAPADLAELSADDRARLDARLGAAPADWHAAWTLAEEAEPRRFARLLAAVYDAYYRAPAVTAHLATLAEAGPRDPDAHFDPSLLHHQRKDRT